MRDQINLTFTKEDVENARQYISTGHCLVATALRRLGYKEINADPFRVVVDGVRYRIHSAFDVLDLYDADHKVVRPEAVGKTIYLL